MNKDKIKKIIAGVCVGCAIKRNKKGLIFRDFLCYSIPKNPLFYKRKSCYIVLNNIF